MDHTVVLEIYPEDINPETWARFYDRSLAYLQQHPTGLLRVASVQMRGGTRLICTSGLEEQSGESGLRHFSVCGNVTSLCLGDSFIVSRSLFHYRHIASGQRPVAPMSAGIGEGSGRPGAYVFYEHTSGYRYEICMVAIGLLAARLFPGAAFLQARVGRRSWDLAEQEADGLCSPEEVPTVQRSGVLQEPCFRWLPLQEEPGSFPVGRPVEGEEEGLSSVRTASSLQELDDAWQAVVGWLARRIGSLLRGLEQHPRAPEELLPRTPSDWRKAALYSLELQGLALTEETWKRLEETVEEEICRVVLALSSLDSSNGRFRNLQRMVLENPFLCRELASWPPPFDGVVANGAKTAPTRPLGPPSPASEVVANGVRHSRESGNRRL